MAGSSLNCAVRNADGSRSWGGKINRGQTRLWGGVLVGLAQRAADLARLRHEKETKSFSPRAGQRHAIGDNGYTTPSWHRRSRQPQPSRAWDTPCRGMIAGRSAWRYWRQDWAQALLALPFGLSDGGAQGYQPLLPTTLILRFLSSLIHNTHKQHRQTDRDIHTDKTHDNGELLGSEGRRGHGTARFFLVLVHQLGVRHTSQPSSYPFSLVVAAHR